MAEYARHAPLTPRHVTRRKDGARLLSPKAATLPTDHREDGTQS